MNDRYNEAIIGPIVITTRPISQGSRNRYPALLSRPASFRRSRFSSGVLAFVAIGWSRAQRWRSWHQPCRFDFISSTNFCAASAVVAFPKRTSVP